MRARIDLDAVLLYAVQFSTFLIAVTNILSLQNGFGGIWRSFAFYARFFACCVNAVVLLLDFMRRGTVNLVSAKIAIILLYVCGVAFLVYRLSFLRFVGDAMTWPLTYLVFYQYFSRKDFPAGYRRILILLHLLCCLLLVGTVTTLGEEETNPGPVYHAIVYLPMILLLCGKKTKIVLSLFTTILVVVTAKRAGLLALGFGFCGYFVIKTLQSDSAKKKARNIAGIIFLSVALVVVASFFSDISGKIMQRFSSISEDKGSGRLRIWTQILTEYKESTVFEQLFGHGVHSVPGLVRPSGKGIFAHNSYVEFLFDFGVVGVLFLLCLVVNMTWFVWRLFREKKPYAAPAFFALSIIVVFSLTSYCFEESNYIVMIASFWGAARGMRRRERTQLLFDRKVW